MGSEEIPAAALVAAVEDPEIADWLLSQSQLREPVQLRARLSGPQALRHMKSDVNRAVTAAQACADLDALDRFSRDARVSVKRAVARSEQLLPGTIERLWRFSLDKRDELTLAGLLDKIDLDQVEESLSHDDPSTGRLMVAHLIGEAGRTKLLMFARRVVADGSWRLLHAASHRQYTAEAFAFALGEKDPDAPGLEFSDPLSPFNSDRDWTRDDPQLPLVPLLASVKRWDRARSLWASKLYERQFELGVRDGSALCGYDVPTYSVRFRSVEAARTGCSVDDDAAPALVAALSRSVSEVDRVMSRRSAPGAIAALMRRELPRAVAADARQASRHFDALASSGIPDVSYTLMWTLCSAKRSLAAPRDERLAQLAAEQNLSQSEEGLPLPLGRSASSETLLALLRSGDLGVTLGWLLGKRFTAPTPELMSALVVEPGRAFTLPGYSFRRYQWRSQWWQQMPPPRGHRGGADEAASWLLDMLAWQPSDLSDGDNEDAAALRRNLSEALVSAAVDAAGPAGVRAALAHPAWLVGRITRAVGYSREVWETLVRLTVDWEQSLSELISTSALLVGVEVADDAPEGEHSDEADEADVSAAGQLSLL